MEKYKSLEGAEKVLATKAELLKEKLCPAFRMSCMGEKCMSFYSGGVSEQKYSYEPERNHFIVHDPFCMSPLVTGTITTEEA